MGIMSKKEVRSVILEKIEEIKDIASKSDIQLAIGLLSEVMTKK